MNWNPDRSAEALRFAAQAHLGQLYPGTGLPYLVHLGLVFSEVTAALARRPEADGDLAVCCAWLHDTMEDAGVIHACIEAQFGAPVADGVSALTKIPYLDPLEKIRDSLERILARPREVGMVKLADRIANMGPPPGHWTLEKRAAYRDEALVIHGALAGADSALADRLLDKIRQYERYLRS